MDLILGVVYGAVQGLTEFLPVSSSGHLALLPKLMNFTDPGVAFDLWLHVGTALAIMVYFKSDLVPIIKEAPKLLDSTYKSSSKNLLINLLTATLISFIFVLLFKNLPAATTRTPVFISINLIVFGLLMWLSDLIGKSDKEIKFSNIQIKNSLLIGLFQAVAIFPGVSRSGVTLTIARYLGVPRQEAANFSFILSLPIVLGGMLVKVPELLQQKNIDMSLMSIGLIVSFFIGIISIHFFLKIIKKVGLGIFCFYRIILAAMILSNF
jgi:undecaprenyl-diphosphatase